MKINISLKYYLSLSFLAMALLLVAGYTVLSLNFYGRGLDNVTSANLAHAAQMYVDFHKHGFRPQPGPPPQLGPHMQPGPPPPPPHEKPLQIVTAWENMPEEIREAFKEPLKEGVLYKHQVGNWFEPPKELIFVMRLRIEDQDYFVRQTFTPETTSPLMGRQMAETMRMLFTVSGLTVIALCLLTWLLFRRISGPVRALEAWAADLDEQNLKRLPPDFSYPELNNLAELIRNSLIVEHMTLERERLFLSYSSHELRTPISVVLASTELLQKVFKECENERGIEKSIVQRIDRAGRTMAHLVETLLWLGKDAVELPVSACTDLESMLLEIIRDADYLRAGKNLELTVKTEPCTLRIPETAARIVLGNVVRNAFQHTLQGTICIQQRGNVIEVANVLHQESDLAKDIGFGLGLELTRRLTDRMGWIYEHKPLSGRNVVVLCLTEPHPAGIPA